MLRAALALPNAVGYVEHRLYLPVTESISGLEHNYPRIHLTAKDEGRTGSDPKLVTRALTDRNVEVLKTLDLSQWLENPFYRFSFAPKGPDDMAFIDYVTTSEELRKPLSSHILANVGAGPTSNSEPLTKVLSVYENDRYLYQHLFFGAMASGQIDNMNTYFYIMDRHLSPLYVQRGFISRNYTTYDGLWSLLEHERYRMFIQDVNLSLCIMYDLLVNAPKDILERGVELLVKYANFQISTMSKLSVASDIRHKVPISSVGLTWILPKLGRISFEFDIIISSFAIRAVKNNDVKSLALALSYNVYLGDHVAYFIIKDDNVFMFNILNEAYPSFGKSVMDMMSQPLYNVDLDAPNARDTKIYQRLTELGIPEPEWDEPVWDD